MTPLYYAFAHISSPYLVKNPITRFFPAENVPELEAPVPEILPQELDAGVKQVLSEAIQKSSSSGEKTTNEDADPGVNYEAFGHLEDLNAPGKMLYEAAGKSAVSIQYTKSLANELGKPSWEG